MPAYAPRDRLPVELVDESGTAVGTCSAAEAHEAPGRRHRAFSVLLYDGTGRVLLQQRASGKSRFPDRWSNTCCGHPAPGEEVAAAAARRLSEEMGIGPAQTTPLTEAGAFHYRAADLATGHVEDEWDHILIATLMSGVPRPDESEVRDIRWAGPDGLRGALTSFPGGYTPWLTGVLDLAAAARSRERHGRSDDT
ncbi:MAG TPA: isopentenyl-diphosphate Delta-isomerase [Trebonia sp.]|jgi:isopentenyl-diphosphate delta-isomerase|nr:isopentenyl-diphosphate Delta-isomerase [Trebonia sp.]